MTADRSSAQAIGSLFGALYVAIGVLGFVVMGFQGSVQDAQHTLLGLPISLFANLAHLGIGGFLLLMTTRMPAPVAEGAVLGVGLFFIVASVIGITGTASPTIFSTRGGSDVQNLHHAVIGIALLTLGVLSSRQTEAACHRADGRRATDRARFAAVPWLRNDRDQAARDKPERPDSKRAQS
jgi:hypothetical protein